MTTDASCEKCRPFFHQMGMLYGESPDCKRREGYIYVERTILDEWRVHYDTLCDWTMVWCSNESTGDSYGYEGAWNDPVHHPFVPPVIRAEAEKLYAKLVAEGTVVKP